MEVIAKSDFGFIHILLILKYNILGFDREYVVTRVNTFPTHKLIEADFGGSKKLIWMCFLW